MNKIIIHPLAQKEFESRVTWLKLNGYLVNSAGIFHDEIREALDELERCTHHRKIEGAPGYFRVGPTRTHRYSIIYKIKDSQLYLVAFAAPQRRPGYWKSRRI